MDQKLQKALYIILLSLGLALVFNYLFFSKAIGLSVFVFNVVLLGAVFGFAHYQKLDFKRLLWLAVPILFFALMPTIRASEFLTFLNVVATFGLLMILAYHINGTPVFLMKLRDYATLAVLVPFRMLGRALHTLSQIGQIHSTVKSHDVWVRILKGALMALPILVIFGALFSQADLAFSQFLNNFISINITEHTAHYLILLAFAFVACLCYLSYVFFPKDDESLVIPLSGIKTPPSGVIPAHEPESSSKDSNLDPGYLSKATNSGMTKQGAVSDLGIETLVFLSLVACLFLVFIGFQVTYLFGGQSNITEWGFTYAEYARRGFGELLGIALLTLALLFLSDRYTNDSKTRSTYFLAPSLVLITEVIVVIISALKRMSLYIDAYGLTEPRLYGSALILLLLALFILLAITFVRSKQEEFFMSGTLISLLTCIALLNFLNPDAHIAQYNLNRYTRTGKIDIENVGYLSADAASAQVKLYTQLTSEDKELLKSYLIKHAERLEQNTTHWQSFNISRSHASTLHIE